MIWAIILGVIIAVIGYILFKRWYIGESKYGRFHKIRIAHENNQYKVQTRLHFFDENGWVFLSRFNNIQDAIDDLFQESQKITQGFKDIKEQDEELQRVQNKHQDLMQGIVTKDIKNTHPEEMV